MVAGGLPTMQVLLDNGTGTFPYDITTYARLVEGYVVKRGRQDELAAVTPGDLSLWLDNSDGRFTIGSTLVASPSPIVVDQQIRLKVTANATTVNRHTGRVQQWPVTWPDGSDQLALVQILSTDAQARGEGRPLRSVVEEEIMLDFPVAYFTLGEPAGALRAADSSGSQSPALTMVGTGADVVFGTATGPPTDGLTVAQFAAGKYLSAATDGTGIGSFLCSFSTTTAGVATLIQGDSKLGSGFTQIGIDAAGHLTGSFATAVATQSTFTVGSVIDGATHVVELHYDNVTTVLVYLDGVQVFSAATTVIPPVDVITVGKAFVGSIGHVAIFPSATAARAVAHATAMRTGFAGESGTARITRLAGYAGLPLGTLDTSLTNVAFSDFTDKSVSDALRDVADAEFGLVFYDGSGNLTFHNRNRTPAKTAPDITIDANQLAEDTAFIVDKQGLLNYYKVTAAGTSVTQLVRNTVSESGDGTATHPAHGRYPGSATYLVLTDAEALDRGNWTVYAHAQPLPRLGQLVLDVLTMTAAQQAQFLALEPNTWLRVTGLPGQTPGGTTADFVVEGFADKAAATEWTLTANVVNRSLFAAWILGGATYGVLGSTTRLYV